MIAKGNHLDESIRLGRWGRGWRLGREPFLICKDQTKNSVEAEGGPTTTAYWPQSEPSLSVDSQFVCREEKCSCLSLKVNYLGLTTTSVQTSPVIQISRVKGVVAADWWLLGQSLCLFVLYKTSVKHLAGFYQAPPPPSTWRLCWLIFPNISARTDIDIM